MTDKKNYCTPEGKCTVEINKEYRTCSYSEEVGSVMFGMCCFEIYPGQCANKEARAFARADAEKDGEK